MTLTAPVGVEVSVQVDPDAAAPPADRAVLPPHSVLETRRKESQMINQIKLKWELSNDRFGFLCSYCGPGLMVPVRVENRQDVNVHVVQDVGDILDLTVIGQRLRGGETF